jgi:hypothetical protein
MFWFVVGGLVLLLAARCRWESRNSRYQWGTSVGSPVDRTDAAARSARQMIGTTFGLGIGADMGGGGDG